MVDLLFHHQWSNGKHDCCLRSSLSSPNSTSLRHLQQRTVACPVNVPDNPPASISFPATLSSLPVLGTYIRTLFFFATKMYFPSCSHPFVDGTSQRFHSTFRMRTFGRFCIRFPLCLSFPLRIMGQAQPPPAWRPEHICSFSFMGCPFSSRSFVSTHPVGCGLFFVTTSAYFMAGPMMLVFPDHFPRPKAFFIATFFVPPGSLFHLWFLLFPVMMWQRFGGSLWWHDRYQSTAPPRQYLLGALSSPRVSFFLIGFTTLFPLSRFPFPPCRRLIEASISVFSFFFQLITVHPKTRLVNVRTTPKLSPIHFLFLKN